MKSPSLILPEKIDIFKRIIKKNKILEKIGTKNIEKTTVIYSFVSPNVIILIIIFVIVVILII